MAQIIELTDNLSNKIAAGEVVERPASVIKELVENAIDAKSTIIDVLIEEAGMTKMTVIDNGAGIEPEDVSTAFRRHATSKIKTEKDLFRVHTLGFRGEALPSIASVAKVKLTTSAGDTVQRLLLKAEKRSKSTVTLLVVVQKLPSQIYFIIHPLV